MNSFFESYLFIFIEDMYKLQVQSYFLSAHKFFAAQLPAINHKPQVYSGPSYEQIVKDRKSYMPGFYFHYYKNPVLIV
jgi:hypothetical protein